MAYRRPGPTRPKVSISPELHARAVLASGQVGKPLDECIDAAVTAWLEATRHALKVGKLEAGQREARRTGNPSPSPEQYGLPRDFGIPPALR